MNHLLSTRPALGEQRLSRRYSDTALYDAKLLKNKTKTQLQAEIIDLSKQILNIATSTVDTNKTQITQMRLDLKLKKQMWDQVDFSPP